jgi:hypothetical protein
MLLVVIQWGQLALLALQALLVLQEQLAHLEQLVLQEQLDLLDLLAHQDHRAHQGPLSNKIFRKNWLMDLNPSAN